MWCLRWSVMLMLLQVVLCPLEVSGFDFLFWGCRLDLKMHVSDQHLWDVSLSKEIVPPQRRRACAALRRRHLYASTSQQHEFLEGHRAPSLNFRKQIQNEGDMNAADGENWGPLCATKTNKKLIVCCRRWFHCSVLVVGARMEALTQMRNVCGCKSSFGSCVLLRSLWGAPEHHCAVSADSAVQHVEQAWTRSDTLSVRERLPESTLPTYTHTPKRTVAH